MARPIDHSDDPDMPEVPNPRSTAAIDAALQSGSRIGRITGAGGEGYDPSRTEEEYGNTIDFAEAKAAREAGVQVNRYPGKCFNCSKSIAPGRGETVHASKVPQEKRRAGSGSQWMVKCTGDSCVTKTGRVKGGAVRTTPAAQGATVTKAKIGKAGGGRHRVEQTHDGNTSSMEWHPRSGVFSFDIHPAHQGIGMEDALHRNATGTASREGYIQPRPLKDS
jgi:hypothetical protein